MVFTLTFAASKGYCGGGGQIVIDQNWITSRSTTLCYDKKAQDVCYNESKACRDDFEKGLSDLLNKTCPIQSGDWWCDPDPTKDLAKLLSYVDQFKSSASFLTALKTCSPVPPAVCADHILNGNDECDDGNTLSGDGCSSQCLIEIPSDVEGSCYQNLHDGSCAQKKQACDLIQGDKNCP
jgi:cysteine-rich repeat protein